jgi:protein-S-isoprenylcysteine O-methyltransferase Ste14
MTSLTKTMKILTMMNLTRKMTNLTKRMTNLTMTMKIQKRRMTNLTTKRRVIVRLVVILAKICTIKPRRSTDPYKQKVEKVTVIIVVARFVIILVWFFFKYIRRFPAKIMTIPAVACKDLWIFWV